MERLQEITEEDAKAEGVQHRTAGHDGGGPIKTYRTGFVYVWSDLHGPDSWAGNPGVVVIAFKVHRCNVDAFLARAA
jgi:hypothetical protein